MRQVSQQHVFILVGVAFVAVVTWSMVASSIEWPLEVEPATLPEFYTSKIDIESLPEPTVKIYQAIRDGKLSGSQANDYESLLAEADEVERRSKTTWYMYKTANYDRDTYEGEPFIFVLVQNKYDLIYRCGVSAPEF